VLLLVNVLLGELVCEPVGNALDEPDWVAVTVWLDDDVTLGVMVMEGD